MRSADLADELREGAEALGCPLDNDQVERLLHYLDLLRRWNRVHNLTSVDEPRQGLHVHLLDCLAVVAPLRRELANTTSASPRLLDVGSGAGLPGLVLADAMPEVAVTCIDAAAKKASFVRHAASELKLQNVVAEHGRVEALKGRTFDVVMARAFSSLGQFVSLTQGLLTKSGMWMAMKGQPSNKELDELKDKKLLFHVEPLDVSPVAGRRCLVWMRPA